MIKRAFLTLLLAGLLSWSIVAISGPYGTNVIINGYELTPADLMALQAQLGTPIYPGYYRVYQNGCWVNLSTGRSGCLGSSGSYTSRYGSGERNAQGDWSHWSDMAGGSVGGTGDGCVYAFGWSNC